jgi:hypothetical protein
MNANTQNILNKTLSSDAGIGALALRIPVGEVLASYSANILGWWSGLG